MLQHHRLDWNAPLLPAVTAGLLERATNEGKDLRHLLALVPTRQAGRRLRQSLLAQQADLKLPAIQTPDAFLAVSLPTPPVGEGALLAAWFASLNAVKFSDYPAVFPKEPPATTAWFLSMAQSLLQLRRELGEAGLTLATAAEKAAEAGLESDRWRQLARLESQYLETLHARKLEDPILARRAAAENYRPPEGIEQILLLAIPDPQALPLLALAQAESVTVEVWHYGPANCFDSWGRPLPDLWAERPLQFEDWGAELLPCRDPRECAARLAESVAAAPEAHCLGLVDPSLAPYAERALQQKGLPAYDPEGRALHLSGSGHLAELWCNLCEQASLQNLRALLQNPLNHRWLDTGAPAETLLIAVDTIFEKHLVSNLETLLQFAYEAPLSGALKKIDATRRALLQASNFPEALRAHLQALAAANESAELDENLEPCLAAGIEAAKHFAKLPPAFHRLAFKQALRKSKTYPPRPEGAHDLLGWLELLWDDAPHLSLAGLNEGIVPEARPADSFLPETLREILGLRTEAQRFARDAYLLEALCHRRAGDRGRLQFLVPQTLADGTPAKPSRLLFQAPDAEFLERIQAFFQDDDEAHAPSLSHSLPWRLAPPPGLSLPEHFSPSSLRSYLQCPFRFFLRHIMGLRPAELAARELTPANFGNRLHDVLAELAGRQLTKPLDTDALARELKSSIAKNLERRYGKQPSFALRLQQEALEGRLQAFVTRQAEDLEIHGATEIRAAEQRFEMILEGFKIKGFIDRVDSGNAGLTLYDYKTADNPKTPAAAHLATATAATTPKHLPGGAFFDLDGKTYRWTDLQLPLYALAAREAYPETRRPRLAYINLAKTLDKSAFDYWDDFTEAHLDSARECAVEVIQQIKTGVFWPPNAKLRESYDDFAALFPDGIENSVDPETFKCYPFKT